MLIPGVTYTFETLVDCLSEKGISDVIKVSVSELSPLPLLSR